MSLLDFLGFKPTLPRFATQIIKAIPEEERAAWSFDAERSSLRHPGGAELTLFNMFREYAGSRSADRPALIEKYAALARAHTSEIPDLWVGAAPNIYPVLRSEFVESTVEIRARAEKASLDPLVFPFVGDIRIRLMYDFGHYLGYVRNEQLATWGQSADAVLERAIANLGRLDPPAWVDSGKGHFQLQAPSSFEESLMLLDSVVRTLPFAEHAVLMPCNRGVLLAADSRSEDCIEAMLLEAERCLLDAPWAMSSTMCKRDGARWAEFRAPVRLANLAHGLDIRHRAEFHAAQKAALESLHEAQGDDVYVAEHSIITADEQWQSYCVWSQGVRTLLPVADWVALLPEGDEAEHLRVLWKDLTEVCGARMQATEESPPRFLVESFPDEREWAELSARRFGD